MNENIIWDKLLASGLTCCGVAGLMGNLYAESLLNPKNLENYYERKLGFTDESYTAAVDSGSYTNFVHDCAGYGLAQWTYRDRKQNLLAFAKERGCSVGDLDMQIDFLLYELRTSFSSVWNVLCKADSIRVASDAVMLQFERPADTSESERAKRSAFGQQYFEQFSQVAPETPPMPAQFKSVSELAQEVLSGIWGNAPERKANLETAGYDYDAVQKEVNRLVSVSRETHTVASGDTLTDIAQKYHTSVQAVLDKNKANYPDMTADFIRVGWILDVS